MKNKNDDGQSRLSFPAAQERRDEGIGRAEGHAERVAPGWKFHAYTILQNYLANHKEPFLAEDFIEWSRQNNFPQPPDDRAWGGVFTSARRHKRIERVGFALAKTSNLGPKSLWKRAS